MEQRIDLSRFVEAHKRSYSTALAEIRNGRKTSHWMWYIFPQVQGLGQSTISQYYAIKSADEAAAYLSDPYLGGHLTEISGVLLKLETNDPTRVFGRPDDMKLRSCMTLFASVSDGDNVFSGVLNKFFDGKPDRKTLSILKK